MVKGIGKFLDCIGLPLIFIVNELKKDNSVIDWCDFIDYIIDKNWNIEQTISLIEETFDDREERKQIVSRIKIYLMFKYDY